mmetsp:Transcript_23387/g.51208  ORF Transcript_23387/g.51208 Transcript_23387/m.51208 type:complete len:320 (-) Transcript_23387:1046-2005(-)
MPRMDRQDRPDPGRYHGVGTRGRLPQDPKRGHGSGTADQRNVAGHHPVPGNTRLEDALAAAHGVDEGLGRVPRDADSGRSQSYSPRVHHCPPGGPEPGRSPGRWGAPQGTGRPQRVCLVHPSDARSPSREPLEDFRDCPGLPAGPDHVGRGTPEASHLRQRIRDPGYHPAVGPGGHAGSQGGPQERQSRPVFRSRSGSGIPSAGNGRWFRVAGFQGRGQGLQNGQQPPDFVRLRRNHYLQRKPGQLVPFPHGQDPQPPFRTHGRNDQHHPGLVQRQEKHGLCGERKRTAFPHQDTGSHSQSGIGGRARNVHFLAGARGH